MHSSKIKEMKNNKLNFNPDKWDWYSFLDASDEVKEMHHNTAIKLSSSWVTCACGQLCEVLPKGFHNRPLDDSLEDLGVLFMKVIDAKDYTVAKTTLDKRTAYLLTLPNYTDKK